MTTRDYEDSHILTGDGCFRALYNFSLLCRETPAPLVIQKGAQYSVMVLLSYQTVYLLLVPGHKSNYWVTVCLNENFSGKELRLVYGIKGETNGVHGDSSTSEPRFKLIPYSQAYSFAGSTRQLEKIVKHHGQILWGLRKRSSIYAAISNDSFAERPPHQRKWDRRKCFPKVLQRTIDYNSRLVNRAKSLLADLIIDSVTTLYGELQQGLGGDTSILRSLHAIEALCVQMRDFSVHLNQLRESYNEARWGPSSALLFASHHGSSE